jgi:PIN domain nuclease of toxin-antitoxin system
VKVLLDTHALLGWVLENPRLSSVAMSVLCAAGTVIVVSAVSGHEIATKYRLGKLSVPTRLAEDLDGLAAENGWQPLPLTLAHAQLAGRLPGAHKDPFDRMLAAQALVENTPGCDQRFCVSSIWGKGNLVVDLAGGRRDGAQHNANALSA